MENLRKTGIRVVPYVPWGTHLCQFYRSRQELLELLVPYFRAGLENNEYCMWITAEPLGEESARGAMTIAMPDFDRYLKKGQMEIIPHDRWFLRNGVFDMQMVLEGWMDKLNHALEKGYDGLRASGNTAWLESKVWDSFTKYEALADKYLPDYRMIAICSYRPDPLVVSKFVDVLDNHQSTLIKGQNDWTVVL
ncbi:MEDS domain-containing protein [Chloroflexota bacterium]